jgi:dTDP-glucose 4,6-dehydratase
MPGSRAAPVVQAGPAARDLDEVATDSGPVFESLRGSRILVTGGTGFVGRWLLETLLWVNRRVDLGVRLIVLTRDPVAFTARSPHLVDRPDLELLEGDIRSFEFPKGRVDRVLHLAAETNVDLRGPSSETYFSVIVDGTRRLIDFVDGKGVGSLLFVSSGAVYGPRPLDSPPIGEDDAVGHPAAEPNTPYGTAKLQAEALVDAYAAETSCQATIARCFAFVGPYLPLDSGFAIGNFIRDAQVGREIVIAGDGSPRRTYMYATDMAAWLWTIAVRGASRRAYNVGSSEVVTIQDLATAVASAVGDDVAVVVRGDASVRGAGSSYVPDTRRAKAELGLGVKVDLHEGIDRTLAWLGAHPAPTDGVTA